MDISSKIVNSISGLFSKPDEATLLISHDKYSNLKTDFVADKIIVMKQSILPKAIGRFPNVRRAVDFYNPGAIISVGCRGNSRRATNFRIWATSVFKEYMLKGLALI